MNYCIWFLIFASTLPLCGMNQDGLRRRKGSKEKIEEWEVVEGSTDVASVQQNSVDNQRMQLLFTEMNAMKRRVTGLEGRVDRIEQLITADSSEQDEDTLLKARAALMSIITRLTHLGIPTCSGHE